MKKFIQLLDLAATLGFLYCMTRPKPMIETALWMLAVRTGCSADQHRQKEGQP